MLEIKPLPFGLDHYLLDNVHYKGRTVRIEWDRAEGLSVHVDGELAAFCKSLEPLEAKL